MSLGLCITPAFLPTPGEQDELRPLFYRSILYKLSDIDILLAKGLPLFITLNNQCQEVRGDWSGWNEAVYKLLEKLKSENKLDQLLVLGAGNELDLYWHSNGSVPPLFGADLAIRTARIARNYGVKVAATSLAGPRWPEYLQTMADICRNEVDYFDIHPYGQRPDGWKDGEKWMHGDLRNVVNTVKDIGQRDVVISEYGVKIKDAGGNIDVANFLTAVNNATLRLGVKYTSWFAYSDIVGAPEERGDSAFGLISDNNNKRVAYYAFSQVNKMNQPTPSPTPTNTDYSRWSATVGKGILEMMKADNTTPAMASEWRPFDRLPNSPATIEQCIGLNGTVYMWHLPTNKSWRHKAST